MFLEKEEKELLGRYFKYHREINNITIKDITSTGICEYRAYKRIEEGTSSNDDLLDSLMTYFNINFEVVETLRKINPFIEQLYNACEWYDNNRIKEILETIRKQVNPISSKSLITELLKSIDIIEQLYLLNHYLKEKEIYETFKLVEIWNNKLSSLLIEVCGLSNSNVAVSYDIAYKIGDYTNKNDLISRYWYAKSCTHKMNYAESLEIYNELESNYKNNSNKLRYLDVLQRKYFIYRDIDDKKAEEYTKILLKYLEKDDISLLVKAPIYYNIAMYYYLNSRYEEALKCYEKDYNIKENDKALLFICTCKSRLNQLDNFKIEENIESVLYPYIHYFYLKKVNTSSKELEDYITAELLSFLMNEKYEYPLWNMFNYEMSELVKKTRNYKKYHEFQEKMQFATKNTA